MKLIDTVGYYAALQTVTSASDDESLVALNVRVHRSKHKSELLSLLLSSLIRLRKSIQTFKKEFRESDSPKDDHAYVHDLMQILSTTGMVEGALSMLLAIAESDKDQDEIGQLQARMQNSLDWLEKAHRCQLLHFPDEIHFSMSDVTALFNGQTVRHPEAFKPKVSNIKPTPTKKTPKKPQKVKKKL